MRRAFRNVTSFSAILFFLSGILLTSARAQTSAQTAEMERNRHKAEFARNFSELQNTGYAILREHEEGRLTADKLGKSARKIHKLAGRLRQMVLLGELQAPIVETRDPLTTPAKYDLAIRRLSRLIYNFAHNPVHQNRRVFNTDQAQQALVDLETILQVSKFIGDQARGYKP